jgi:hypothetical protein
MENSILTAARTEQRELEKQLLVIDAEYAEKKKPLVKRLEAVRLLRAAYGDVSPSSGLDTVSDGLVDIGGAFRRGQIVRENSHKARVLSAAMEILGSGISLPTRELLERIEQRGIQFNASNKAGNLSVILSKDERFVSDRRDGWSLKKQNPQDASPSAGLFAATAASQPIAPKGPTRTE